uniref:Alpha-carbonic anhydrase domain-containing protein n=1 Tax=Cynoglossus semilaevis TaxID=244447 RepID=A0A3P8WPS8_CYNSE
EPHSWTHSDVIGPSFPSRSGRQSPVDIDEAFAPVRLQYQHLQLEGWERTIAESSTVHNNGKTVFVDVEGEFFVSGGGLSSRYRVSRVLFHWGRCNATSDGSEHSVNGQRSPLEVTLAVLFEVSAPCRSACVLFLTVHQQSTVRLSPQVSKSGSLEAFTLGSLLPNNTDKYFIYNGSLTVPPCSEVVEWIVFKDRVDISETQLQCLFLMVESSTPPPSRGDPGGADQSSPEHANKSTESARQSKSDAAEPQDGTKEPPRFCRPAKNPGRSEWSEKVGQVQVHSGRDDPELDR